VNKIFEKRSSQLLNRFFKFFIIACLPLHRTLTEGHRLQRELRQTERRLHRQEITSHVQFLLSNHVLHIKYIDLHRHDFDR
jgi:hypothetical protein